MKVISYQVRTRDYNQLWHDIRQDVLDHVNIQVMKPIEGQVIDQVKVQIKETIREAL